MSRLTYKKLDLYLQKATQDVWRVLYLPEACWDTEYIHAIAEIGYYDGEYLLTFLPSDYTNHTLCDAKSEWWYSEGNSKDFDDNVVNSPQDLLDRKVQDIFQRYGNPEGRSPSPKNL